MKSKILVICPSRGRPALCKKMLDSFQETQKRSSIHLLLDFDDPCLNEYKSLCGPKCDNIIIDFRKPCTQLINQNWKKSPSIFQWFSVTNDDFVYKTDGWDEKFVETLDGRQGIIYGNDLLQGVNMPTTSVISREIPEALGWLQMPTLHHLFGDNVWLHLGSNAKCLFYLPNVVIEHQHYFNNKNARDEIYQYTNSQQMYDRDTLAYMNWHLNQAKKDIETVREVVSKFLPTKI